MQGVRVPSSKLVGQFALVHGQGHSPPREWVRHEMDGWALDVHPTVGVLELLMAGRTAGWLLGTALEGDHVLTKSLVLQSSEVDERDLYERLGGAWVLVALRNRRLFFDPLGQMALVYSPAQRVVASTPGLIQAPEDRELAALIGLPERDNWYPFGLTPLRGVRRLLPNHWLDLDAWVARRHWPEGPLGGVSIPDGVRQIASTVRMNIDALASEFPLQANLTAGRDTRMVLACARRHVRDMVFVTNESHNPEIHVDLQASRYLARRFGLKHIVRQREEASREELAEWFEQVGRTNAGAALLGVRMTNQYDPTRARLSGQGGEVGRAYYWRLRDPEDPQHFSPDLLLNRMSLPANAALIQAAAAWIDGLPQGVDARTLLDLLYIEQRMGCWAGPARYGGRSAHMVFWPVDHRLIIRCMLQLPKEYARSEKLAEDVIRLEWPELLCIPFNEAFGWAGIKARVALKAKQFARRVQRLPNRLAGKR